MPVFRLKDYALPKTLQEATAILKDYGEKARVLAGGTTFYEIAKRGMISDVEVVVDIEKVGLDYVKDDNGIFRLGAMCTLSELFANSELVGLPAYGAILDALAHFTPLQIRNLATVGGEICAGVPFLDLPPVLLALDAKLLIVADGKERVRPLDGFFMDFFLNDLESGEIVSEIQIPKSAEKTGSAFQNIKRNAVDLALVNAAVQVALNGEECKKILIGVGGMGRIPVRARKVEKILEGKKLDPKTIAEGVENLSDLNPISSFHAPPEYKHEVCKVLVRDAILEAVRRAKGDANA